MSKVAIVTTEHKPHISPEVALIREALDVLTGSTGPVTEDAFTEPARAALSRLEEQLESTRTALETLLDHTERIQEHVPKSENWYAVRDCARIALSNPVDRPQ